MTVFCAHTFHVRGKSREQVGSVGILGTDVALLLCSICALSGSDL